MTDRETIHTDFQTITKYDQDYRVSTKVEFSASGTFYSTVRLYKSYNGKVKGNPLYKTRSQTRNEDEIEKVLQEDVDRCCEKIDDIERAKLLDIDVRVK